MKSISLPAILFGVLPEFAIKASNAIFSIYFKCLLRARGEDSRADTTSNYKQKKICIYLFIYRSSFSEWFESGFLDKRKHWRDTLIFYNFLSDSIKTKKFNVQI